MLPSRLIDLSPTNGSNLHLLETASGVPVVPYATLSYCWGGTNKFRLTSSTLQHFKDGFALSNLPRTIQDAVLVTRNLGIQYLWVDALCIIQDNPADWAKEVSSMSQVYRNSILTIGAMGAVSSEQGLFSQRDPLFSHACLMFENKEGCTFYLAPADPLYPISGELLHKRGWVMQERLLSPRTLNFSSYMAWECCESLWYENRIRQLRWISPAFCHTEHLKRLLGQIDATPGPSSPIKISVLDRFWKAVKTQYTYSQLSLPSDRLAAIRGIIQFVQDKTGWKNIHGLWEPTLIRELLWRAAEVTVSEAPVQSRLPRIAPTWSWGSIDTGIESCDGILTYGVEARVTGDTDEILQIHTFLLPLSLEPMKSRPAENNVKSGFNLDDLFCTVTGNGHSDPQVYSEQCFLVILDINPAPDGPYFFAPVIVVHSVWGQTRRIQGLLLVQSPSMPGAYERIGHVESWIFESRYEEFVHRVETEGVEVTVV